MNRYFSNRITSLQSLSGAGMLFVFGVVWYALWVPLHAVNAAFAIGMPLIGIFLSFLGVSLIIRRLHDFNIPGWPVVLLIFGSLFAMAATLVFPSFGAAVVLGILAVILAILFWKGSAAINRYGPVPRPQNVFSLVFYPKNIAVEEERPVRRERRMHASLSIAFSSRRFPRLPSETGPGEPTAPPSI